jgi:hypothetical protein
MIEDLTEREKLGRQLNRLKNLFSFEEDLKSGVTCDTTFDLTF